MINQQNIRNMGIFSTTYDDIKVSHARSATIDKMNNSETTRFLVAAWMFTAAGLGFIFSARINETTDNVNWKYVVSPLAMWYIIDNMFKVRSSLILPPSSVGHSAISCSTINAGRSLVLLMMFLNAINDLENGTINSWLMRYCIYSHWLFAAAVLLNTFVEITKNKISLNYCLFRAGRAICVSCCMGMVGYNLIHRIPDFKYCHAVMAVAFTVQALCSIWNIAYSGLTYGNLTFYEWINDALTHRMYNLCYIGFFRNLFGYLAGVNGYTIHMISNTVVAYSTCLLIMGTLALFVDNLSSNNDTNSNTTTKRCTVEGVVNTTTKTISEIKLDDAPIESMGYLVSKEEIEKTIWGMLVDPNDTPSVPNEPNDSKEDSKED